MVASLIDSIPDWIQRRIGIKNMAYLFILPNMLIFGIFVLFPMGLSIYYAFTGGTNLFPADRPFIGLDNFRTLFDCGSFLDPNSCREDGFWRAVYNTAFFVVVQVGFMVFFSLLTALILNRKIRGRGFFRSVFFYPVLLSPVVVALIWKWILQRQGVLNGMLTPFGIDPVPFLLDPSWSRFWVIVISIWSLMGFYTLILLAGLQSIPANLYEAGQIDGTNKWQQFRYITLPMLMPTLFVVLVLSVIRSVQIFDSVFVLTRGGPGTANLFMVQYIYETGFSNQVQIFGLSSAASVVMAGVLLIFTLIQLRFQQQTSE